MAMLTDLWKVAREDARYMRIWQDVTNEVVFTFRGAIETYTYQNSLTNYSASVPSPGQRTP